MPIVSGPQWLQIVAPACIEYTSSKPRALTFFIISSFIPSIGEEEVTKAIGTYFRELVLGTDDEQDVVVRISAIGAILSRLKNLVDYSDLKLNGDTHNITSGEDDVPVLEEVAVE